MRTDPDIVTPGHGPATASPEPETLVQRLRDVIEHQPQDADVRQPLLRVLREEMEVGRTHIRRRFEAGVDDGAVCVSELAAQMDSLVGALAEVAVLSRGGGGVDLGDGRFDIVATGGYGRAELAPGSDIDLLFLMPGKANGRLELAVETLLYTLWDLGLKVGHAVRSVEDCLRQAKADITIRTNLLETRLIWGSGTLFADLQRRFYRDIVATSGPEFVVRKLEERDKRHHQQGDNRYVLEPNVKDSKGGLRDLQTLFWIGKYLYQAGSTRELVRRGVLLPEEAARFAKAQLFLWTVRCHLHYLTGRAEDRLTFDVQAEIGRRMGYTRHAGTAGVERFMKHYFLIAKDVGDLTRIFCAALEVESRRPRRFNLLSLGQGRRRELEGFIVEGGRLNLHAESQFKDNPIDTLRLFHVAQRHGLDIHPRALRTLTRALGVVRRLRQDIDANRLFLEMLTGRHDPEVTLRLMGEAGVLGRFVPDFGRVVAQMQYDMYHAYTVDAHTLFCLGILHRIDMGELAEDLPLATEVMGKIASRRALYVALFLHDIAKGRGGDHSELGARVTQKLCPRFGLSDEETETVAWLVRHHLAMSFTAFRRDLEDEATLRDFVELVQSPERLRLLLVLTTADIRGVGPGRWNNWKATLLGDLYAKAEDRMSGSFNARGRSHRIELAKQRLVEALLGWAQDDVEWFLGLGYPGYWLTFDPASQAHHASMVREAERSGAPLAVDTRVDRGRSITEVTIYTADHAGLFSQLAGALALSGATIVDARICTLTNGKALDVFTVHDATNGGALESGDKLARLSVMIEQVLSGALRPLHELGKRRPTLPSRTRVFKVAPRVLIDNRASNTHTVVEVNGLDRPGLLYHVTRTLTALSLQISSAKVSTFGNKAVDVFYVKDVFGLKVTHDGKLLEIREKLLAALGEPGCAPIMPGGAATVRLAGQGRRVRHRLSKRRSSGPPGSGG